MTSTARAAQDADPGPATTETVSGPTRSRWGRWPGALHRHGPDLAVCLLFVVLAGWLTAGLWPDPGARVLALNPEDQALYEWFLAMDSRVLHGDFTLLSDRLNAPDGVNLMANTTVIALGFLFAPVTLAFGAPVTFALLAAAGLAGTAIAWYLLFTRLLGVRRLAAGLGAGLCGFGPGIISQSNSHLHMTAQWLVPVLIWLVVRMVRAADPQARPDRPGIAWRRVVTSAAGLAAGVSVQVFIGEETLFLAAVALVVFTLAYAAANWSLARRVAPGFLAGMVLAVVLALPVLAYPLWFQFAGAQSVPNGMFSPHYFYADLASWSAISPMSIAGSPEAARLTTGPAEYNTFLGWPLILAAVLAAGWLIRRPVVIACVTSGIVMAALSLGPTIIVDKEQTGITGPYSLLLGIPVVDGALPMRFALALLPLIATVLALAVDHGLAAPEKPVRLMVPLAAVIALLPIFPAQIPTAARPPLPKFIADGHWRDCVKPNGVLVPVPLPTPQEPWAMRWAAAADASFALPEGFFIGPYAAGGQASMGTYKQPTSQLLTDVSKNGAIPAIGPEQRDQARRDIQFWGASCVVVADDAPNATSLRTTLEALLGPGTRVADAWTWRV
ncbi:hypothetical protein [Plantactinospora endophytica]|uniref:Glycosyl transferase n=1 Tax=Plantactinospora endophytica TaxID=673535 RepID=A0ABQ4E432_9ACTN|nr:hypothetical protein [Plantactinospora endophytica]GIG89471.1 glycosyl transferase [Plantactinospora endophytica]